MNDFTQLVDLASERVGGRVLAANDEFFAPKDNLLKPAKPVWIQDKYTERGKWMDGWETRRRRTPGFDWCIMQLGIPGILRGVMVDTSYFKGNYPEHCSLEACALTDGARVDEVSSDTVRWAEVLPKSALKGDTQNCFEVGDPHRYTHLRFNIYPDGGVARLRVHGEALPDWKRVLALAEAACIDLAAIANGGRVLGASDMFFSAPQNLLMPDKSAHMGDGWETRRRRGPGHDWVILHWGSRASSAGSRWIPPTSREIFPRAVRWRCATARPHRAPGRKSCRARCCRRIRCTVSRSPTALPPRRCASTSIPMGEWRGSASTECPRAKAGSPRVCGG